MEASITSLNPCYTGTYASSIAGVGKSVYFSWVLILVILELTLRGQIIAGVGKSVYGLNPCYTGTYASRFLICFTTKNLVFSLNPCYTGTYASRVTFIKIF